MKKKLSFCHVLIAFVLVAFVLDNALASPSIASITGRFCTPQQVRNVMEAVCYSDALKQLQQKRSSRFFHTPSDVYSKHDQYILWRRIFNIADNTTGKFEIEIEMIVLISFVLTFRSTSIPVTIPEANFQLNLLFGRCNEVRKHADLKGLLEIYQNRDYQKSLYNGERTIGEYPNYGGSNEASLLRYRRSFTETCCDQQCSFNQLKEYCPKLDF